MRVGLVCVLLLGFSSAATITRQIYNAGTPTLGGCTGLNSTKLYTIGQCYNFTNTDFNASYSIKFNECWNNGVISYTYYYAAGTVSGCDPAFALEVNPVLSTIGNQSYCNVAPGNSIEWKYNTFTCSEQTMPSTTQQVQVQQYNKSSGATNCSGTFTIPITIPVGNCTKLPSGLTALANCLDGLVTSTLYGTSDCTVGFNTTGYVNTLYGAFGPYAQPGAVSAVGKTMGTPGSSCVDNTDAYNAYTCVNVNPSSTGSVTGSGSGSSPGSSTGNPAPGTGTPGSGSGSPTGTGNPAGTGSSTGSAPTNSPPNPSTGGNGADTQAIAGMAALIIPIMAAALVTINN